MTSDAFTACPGAPQCEITDDHVHDTRDNRAVLGSGWLVDLVAHPERATRVAPPHRPGGRRRR